ncbi:MAG TPA: transglutaminase-like domain-containing protein [Candidatus Bathyarchaeia archaeon]|nr:transglutaminase-like domain-containing protein [Candidatus Bathyarchaeia archaeon]
MAKANGITRPEEAPQEASKQENTALLMVKMLLKNPSILIRLRRMGSDEERYVAPPRPYELPEYRKGMRYSTSKEPCIRATRWCNPRERLVVALAHELGAYELSDREFAETAYWWMKTKMWHATSGFDGPSATLKRGSGMCFHFINTYIALCRCAGIKCRYKGYQMNLLQLHQEMLTSVDPGLASVFASGPIGEAEAELYIDGTWTAAYLAQPAALTAATGLPITEFGESSLGLYFHAIPGSIRRFESMPLGLWLSLKLTNMLAPATMERLNNIMAMLQKMGSQEIEDAGGIEAYNTAAKRRRELFSADELLDQVALKHYDKIIVKKPQSP